MPAHLGHEVECGKWGFPELRPAFRTAGFEPPEHLLQAGIHAAGVLEVAAILHKDHSGSHLAAILHNDHYGSL